MKEYSRFTFVIHDRINILFLSCITILLNQQLRIFDKLRVHNNFMKSVTAVLMSQCIHEQKNTIWSKMNVQRELQFKFKLREMGDPI